MKKIRLKHIISILITFCLLFITFVFVYSKINPAEAEIDRVSVNFYPCGNYNNVKYINGYFERAKTNDRFQVFCDLDHLPSENTDDYVQVTYLCKFKYNALSYTSEIQAMVEAVPKNDTAYVLSIPPDFLREKAGYKGITIFCTVFICIKGLSEEDIEEKIRAIDISIIYKENNEPKKIKVEGIESLESKDIEYELKMRSH